MNAKEIKSLETLNFAFDELVKKIAKIDEKLETIFGNGKKGMCTIRQEELENKIDKKIEKIKQIPDTIWIWIYRGCLVLGFLGTAFFFFLNYFKDMK